MLPAAVVRTGDRQALAFARLSFSREDIIGWKPAYGGWEALGPRGLPSWFVTWIPDAGATPAWSPAAFDRTTGSSDCACRAVLVGCFGRSCPPTASLAPACSMNCCGWGLLPTRSAASVHPICSVPPILRRTRSSSTPLGSRLCWPPAQVSESCTSARASWTSSGFGRWTRPASLASSWSRFRSGCRGGRNMEFGVSCLGLLSVSSSPLSVIRLRSLARSTDLGVSNARDYACLSCLCTPSSAFKSAPLADRCSEFACMFIPPSQLLLINRDI